MTNPCIVTCCYCEGVKPHRYRPYVARLVKSLEPYKDELDMKAWSDGWPPGSPSHREKHYAFKYHAVMAAARMGYVHIAWLDSACYFVGKPWPMFDEIARRGVYLVTQPLANAGQPLGRWISDKALAYFDVSRDEAMKMPLCAGAVVGLNLHDPKAMRFLNEWRELASSDLFMSSHVAALPDRMTSLPVMDDVGTIVSEDPRCLGHLSDEACFTLMLRKLGIEAVPLDDWHKTMKSGYTLA